MANFKDRISLGGKGTKKFLGNMGTKRSEREDKNWNNRRKETFTSEHECF